MKTIRDDDDRVAPEEWERPDMRAALAKRDIPVVYRLLQQLGFSQQRIAALTGQSQPEVSAIIHGRKVTAYHVLARIADGLGIPRGYMGLSYAVEPGQGRSASTAPMGIGSAAVSVDAGTAAPDESEVDDSVQRREFLGAVAAAAMGGHTPAVEWWLPWPGGPVAAVPVRVGATDVEQVRAAARQLSELDLQLGGGAALDAVTGYLRWASGLLSASCTEATGRELRVALADLYNVAGMALHDAGRHREANQHFLQGLVLARDGEDRTLAMTLLWSMGKISLEQDQVTDALLFFQLAEMAAQDTGDHAELARLLTNQAWAYALLGQRDQVADALARADLERSLAARHEHLALHGAARC